MTSVRAMLKFEFARRGVSHFRDQEPATEIDESWPLFAGGYGVSPAVEVGDGGWHTHVGGDEHPLGECPGCEFLVE